MPVREVVADREHTIEAVFESTACLKPSGPFVVDGFLHVLTRLADSGDGAISISDQLSPLRQPLPREASLVLWAALPELGLRSSAGITGVVQSLYATLTSFLKAVDQRLQKLQWVMCGAAHDRASLVARHSMRSRNQSSADGR
jgi:hypothetical protein